MKSNYYLSYRIVSVYGKEKLHTAEEQHAAMDKICGFTYQFYCFLLHLLKMERGETVSFEKLDDAAIEKGNLITLYQAKHSVQVDANGETKALTNRSSDLWKAIDVWRELIVGKPGRTVDEQKAYIVGHKFCFVSNKPLTDNKVVALCKEVNKGIGTDRIDAVLEAITQEGADFTLPKSVDLPLLKKVDSKLLVTIDECIFESY